MRQRLVSASLAAVFVAAVAACGSVPSLGPTPAGEGIIFYLHADFTGPSQAVNVDVPDLKKVQGSCSNGEEGETPSWGDCISSVKVMPGWTATLYRDDNYKGPASCERRYPNSRSPRPCDKDSLTTACRRSASRVNSQTIAFASTTTAEIFSANDSRLSTARRQDRQDDERERHDEAGRGASFSTAATHTRSESQTSPGR